MESKKAMDIMYANPVFTKVISRKVASMEKAPLTILIIEHIKENGQMVYSRAMGSLLGQMETDTKVSIETD